MVCSSCISPFPIFISVSAPCSWIRIHDLDIRVPTHDRDALVHRTRYAIIQPFVPHSSQPHRDADFVAEHPEFVSPNSAMDFLSDNKGESYNFCHCASLHPSVPLDRSRVYIISASATHQSGATSRLETWTFGADPSTPLSSITWTRTAGSTTRSAIPYFLFPSLTVWLDSGGAMRQCTRSVRHYSGEETRSTSSTRLGTSTPRSLTVPWRRICGALNVVRATLPTALVRPFLLALCC